MKTEVCKFENLKYIVRYPDGYKVGQKCPVIIFLHGAGTRGDDLELLIGNNFLR